MTLRAVIQIVPFGDEDNVRNLFRLDIYNRGHCVDLGFGHQECRYGVKLYEMSLPIPGQKAGGEWEHIYTYEDDSFRHDRRDGAVALVEKAANLVEKERNGL